MWNWFFFWQIFKLMFFCYRSFFSQNKKLKKNKIYSSIVNHEVNASLDSEESRKTNRKNFLLFDPLCDIFLFSFYFLFFFFFNAFYLPSVWTYGFKCFASWNFQGFTNGRVRMRREEIFSSPWGGLVPHEIITEHARLHSCIP